MFALLCLINKIYFIDLIGLFSFLALTLLIINEFLFYFWFKSLWSKRKSNVL